MTLYARKTASGVHLWLVGACLMAVASHASTEDPAATQVQILDDSLLKSMRAGPRESIADRYRQLEPVIQEVFDLPLMARLSVGPAWTNFSPEQQRAVVTAFTHLTIAGYAHNFATFNGEKFAINEHVASRGADKIIQSQIISDHDSPASMIYRARQSGGAWKLIDIYYDGISQLTMHRSDFNAAIAGGGADVLIAHLQSLSDDFMKR